MTNIPATPADGNLLVLAVAAIANVNSPKLTETGAVGSADLSCYITAGGLAVSLDQAVITDERLCTTEVFEQPGRKTHGLSVTAIDNTNSPNELTFNLAVDTLIEGSIHYIVIRRGKAFDAPLAVGDTVRVYPVKAGAKVDDPAEANSTLKSTWKLFITNSVGMDVQIVAGP